jgi:hypothetical protein
MVAHCIFFWGGDIKRAYKGAREGKFDDPHHEHMAKHYKETPWWWYGLVLVVSFVLGLVVVLKENITLSAWAYVISLILGIIFGPFVSSAKTLIQTRNLFNVFYRAWFSMPAMEMELPRTTCRKCLQACSSLDALLETCTLLRGRTMSL